MVPIRKEFCGVRFIASAPGGSDRWLTGDCMRARCSSDIYLKDKYINIIWRDVLLSSPSPRQLSRQSAHSIVYGDERGKFYLWSQWDIGYSCKYNQSSNLRLIIDVPRLSRCIFTPGTIGLDIWSINLPTSRYALIRNIFFSVKFWHLKEVKTNGRFHYADVDECTRTKINFRWNCDLKWTVGARFTRTATSTPCECPFSAAETIVNNQKRSILPENINEIHCFMQMK